MREAHTTRPLFRDAFASFVPLLASTPESGRALVAAKEALDRLIELQHSPGANTARYLFRVKDSIDRAVPDRGDEPARRCARAVLVLARAMALNPEDVRDRMWISAIDAVQELIWILE